MAKPDSWMPLYIADYLADTAHLTTEEHGAYLLLIMHYWRKGGLPNDDKRLSSIAKAGLKQWESIKPVLLEFFEVTENGWFHGRIHDEYEKAQKTYEKRAAAGQKGGRAKATPKPGLSKTQAGLKQPQPQPQPQCNKLHTPHKPPEGALFAEWWSEYPNKKGKAVAAKAYDKALTKTSAANLLTSLRTYVKTKPTDRPWLNPATWLNQERWNDEPDPTNKPDTTATRRFAIAESLGLGTKALDPEHGSTEGGNPASVEGGGERTVNPDPPGGGAGVCGDDGRVVSIRGGVQHQGGPGETGPDLPGDARETAGRPVSQGAEGRNGGVEMGQPSTDPSGDTTAGQHRMGGPQNSAESGQVCTDSPATKATPAPDRPSGVGQDTEALEIPAFLDRRSELATA